MTLLAIAAGGAIGAVARHVVNAIVHRRLVALDFPLGIFIVNVVGCLGIGVLAGLLASGRVHLSLTGRHFAVVGLLGGFTTFSSFGLDTFTLIRGGHAAAAFWNAAGQVLIGMAAVWAGYGLAARP